MSASDPIETISAAFAEMASRNERLEESLSQVQMLLDVEDRGWSLLSKAGNEDFEGFNLDEAKAESFLKLVSPIITLSLGYMFGRGGN